MDNKNATCVKSVRSSISRTYGYYGFRFEIPANFEVHAIEYSGKDYAIVTDRQIFILKACLQCKRLLAYSSFYERRSPCKECHILIVKRWKQRNPEVAKESHKLCNKRYRHKQKLKSVGLE